MTEILLNVNKILFQPYQSHVVQHGCEDLVAKARQTCRCHEVHSTLIVLAHSSSEADFLIHFHFGRQASL